MRRAPLEPEDDAYELQDHEFTLEPEEPTLESRMPLDERVAPSGTVPPLPAWAATSRELLEPEAARARDDAAFYDDEPTPSGEPVECSRSALLALREELALAARELHARGQQIERLERALADTRGSASALKTQLTRQNAELIGQVRGQAFLIAELQQALQLPRAAEITAVLPTLVEFEDDLQRIRGLGKRFVQRLAELGIRRFAQIAAWTPTDVEHIAPQLGVRPKRIQREGWIKQAHKLSERAGLPQGRATRKAAAKPASPARKRKAAGRKRAAR